MAPGPQRSTKAISMQRHTANSHPVEQPLTRGYFSEPEAISSSDGDVDMLAEDTPQLSTSASATAGQPKAIGLGGGRFFQKITSAKKPTKGLRSKAPRPMKANKFSTSNRGQTTDTNIQTAPRDWITDIYHPDIIKHNARHLYKELSGGGDSDKGKNKAAVGENARKIN